MARQVHPAALALRVPGPAYVASLAEARGFAVLAHHVAAGVEFAQRASAADAVCHAVNSRPLYIFVCWGRHAEKTKPHMGHF